MPQKQIDWTTQPRYMELEKISKKDSKRQSTVPVDFYSPFFFTKYKMKHKLGISNTNPNSENEIAKWMLVFWFYFSHCQSNYMPPTQ